MKTQNPQRIGAYSVGQKGEFILLDSFRQPIETVEGEIVQLMAGKDGTQIYAMIMTRDGVRPARLA